MNRLLICISITSFFACQSPANQEKEEVTEETIEEVVDYKSHGKEITAIAQAELMKSVKESLEKGGAAYAIKYCNVHATPLTDSLSRHFNCQIQRISDKNRNPLNAPSGDAESSVVSHYASLSGEPAGMKDTLLESEDGVIYYRPISIAMPTCLKCHGSDSEISDETKLVLNEKYPEDKATGYQIGEFRGLWKVSFN